MHWNSFDETILHFSNLNIMNENKLILQMLGLKLKLDFKVHNKWEMGIISNIENRNNINAICLNWVFHFNENQRGSKIAVGVVIFW